MRDCLRVSQGSSPKLQLSHCDTSTVTCATSCNCHIVIAWVATGPAQSIDPPFLFFYPVSQSDDMCKNRQIILSIFHIYELIIKKI